MNNKIIIILTATFFFLLGGSNCFASMSDYVSVDSFKYNSGVLEAEVTYNQSFTVSGESSQKICFNTVDNYSWSLNQRNPTNNLLTGYAWGVSANDTWNGYSAYCISLGDTITLHFLRLYNPNAGMFAPSTDLTKTNIDNNFGSNWLENQTFNQLVFGAKISSGVTQVESDGLWGYQSWLFPYESIPPIVNGSCGSDNGLTLNSEPTNLCSSGTATELTFIDFGSPMEWDWSCQGSGGGSSPSCISYASVYYNQPVLAQCGYKSGQVYTTEPTGQEACFSGDISDMIQNPDNSWTWNCSGSQSGDTISCSTLASAPLIPGTLPSDNSISCAITPTDLSTIGDCIASIAKWLFLPQQSTLNELFDLKSVFYAKIPWGYVNAFQTEIKSLTDYEQADLLLNINIENQSIPVFDINSLRSQFSTFFDFYFNFMRAVLWIYFALWVYNLARSIFAHRQLTLGI